jgi:hypothetical protein
MCEVEFLQTVLAFEPPDTPDAVVPEIQDFEPR